MGQELSRVIVQRYGQGPGKEEAMVAAAAMAKGFEVVVAGKSELNRCRVTESDLIVGGVPFVLQGMRMAGITPPEPNPYPVVLSPWLHRLVRRLDSLLEAKRMLETGAGECYFVKPADKWKRFTGFVTNDPDDYRFEGASKRSPVWISTPVKFLSEWRCYVSRGRILAVEFANYGGDPRKLPDQERMQAACAALSDSGQAPSGYVIDFGLLETGQTALVEVNDGFSFGAYGNVTGDILLDIMAARWSDFRRDKRDNA